MDPLTQTLVDRQLQGQNESSSYPAVLPNTHARVPQQVKRFSNAQAIQDAYRNGWSPNPVLLRAQLGNK